MYPNYTKAFLNLEGVFIKKVVQADSFIKIFIQSQPVEQTCPCCGAKTKRIHDYRLQKVQDIPLLGKQVILLLRKRRYLCPYCRKRFTEPYSFLPSYHRRTRRLAFYIVSLLRQTFSLKQIAELTGVSVQTVCRLLDTICYPPPDQLPQALSIDEFKGNASTGKYQCILVDSKKRRILDILPDRTQSHLADYWRNIPRKERLKVKFFVCDMWRPYTELAQTFFPNATIIVDKYHFIRQVTWAIENVRKRLQRSMPVSLRKYYKRSRKLILTRYKKLKDENKQACDLMLHYSEDLRLAHRMKEWFYDICQMEAYRQQQSGMPDNVWCEQHDIPVSSFYNAVTRLRKEACAIPESAALSGSAHALDFTSHQDVVRVNMCPNPMTATPCTDGPMAAAHLDNPHTIELMTGGITVKISNSAVPALLAAVFRLLKGLPC